MAILGALKRLPQIIGDSLYQSEPIYQYPSMDSLPVEMQVGDNPPMQLDMGGFPMDQEPVEVGKRRTGKKTGLGRFVTEDLPRMAAAGIAGAATPNIAGGGATDIFRAMQAGQGELQRRDMMAYEMMQRREAAAQRAAVANAQQGMYNSHAALYDAQAAKKPVTFKAKYDELISAGVPPEKALVIASGGTLQDKSDPAEQLVPVDEATGKRFGVLPGPDGTYRIPRSRLSPAPPEKPAKQGTPWRFTQTDGDGKVTAFEQQQDGTFKTTPLGPVGKAQKEKEKAEVTPAQQFQRQQAFARVEAAKNTQMQARRQQFEKEVAGGGGAFAAPATEAQKAVALERYNADMEQIQKAYEEQIKILGGSIAPRKATTPMAPPKPSAAPPAAPNTASGYLQRRFGNQ